MASLPPDPDQELAFLLATGQGASQQVVNALLTTYGAELEKLIRIFSAAYALEGDQRVKLLPTVISLAIQNAPSIERKNSVRAWLFSSAIKSCKAILLQNFRIQILKQQLNALNPQMGDLRPTNIEALTAEHMDRYIDRLTGKPRLAMVLRYGLSMPISLISEIPEIPEQETKKNIQKARQHLLPVPARTAQHTPQAARKRQTDIQSVFDSTPELRSNTTLQAHLENCEDCKAYYIKLTLLDQQISGRLRARWPIRPLSEPTIHAATTQALSIPSKPWPLKELAGIVMMAVLARALFRLLTPAVVDYSPTPTPALLPAQLLEVRPSPGSPLAAGPQKIEYILSKTLIGGTTFVNAITYSPDGNLLVSGSRDNLVRVWGGPDESNLIVLQGHTSEVTSLGFSPSGTFLASEDAEGFIRIWNPLDRFQYSSLDNTPGPIRSLAFSPDGKLLAVSTAKSLWLWIVNKQSFVRVFEYPGEEITSISFSPFGDILALSDENTVYLRRVRDGELVLKYENHTDQVMRVVFSPDGNWLASGGRDKTINVVQINPRSDGSVEAEIIYSLTFESEVTDVAFSKDSVVLAVTTQSGNLSIHFASDGSLAQEIPDDGQFVRYSTVTNGLASIGSDGYIRLWELPGGD
jgi:WD40 repeat protein/DNA-directed RNA polymerase specialized sigma24 family protein